MTHFAIGPFQTLRTRPLPDVPKRHDGPRCKCGAVLRKGKQAGDLCDPCRGSVDLDPWAVVLAEGCDAAYAIAGIAETITGKPREPVTTCKRGHSFSGPNLYITPQGHRRCRTCMAMHNAGRYQRKEG
jgi:hypothetical protein